MQCIFMGESDDKHAVHRQTLHVTPSALLCFARTHIAGALSTATTQLCAWFWCGGT